MNYEPENPYTRNEMMEGRMALARHPSALGARRGLTAEALDEMMQAQWDAGKETGFEDGRREIHEARARAYEEGVADALGRVGRMAELDFRDLDGALQIRRDRRRGDGFTRILERLRQRARETADWAQNRPTISRADTGRR